MIGPTGGIGEESFDFIYCTPHQIDIILLKESYLFGKHYLFVAEYNYITLFEAVESICSSISGSTWREVGEKLGRYGKWEFEDYELQ